MTSRILYIEASAEICSVCIAEGVQIIAVRESDKERSHSELMALFIDQCLNELSMDAKDLAAICIADGPGSYTSLRITAATAKGLCFGANLPLITVGTLEGLVYGVEASTEDLIIPMIDARRDEVYMQVFSGHRQPLGPVSAHILSPESLGEYSYSTIIICGNGAEKASRIIENSKVYLKETTFSSTNLVRPGYDKFIKADFVDILSYTPFYLKSPNITTPRQSI